MQTCPWQVLDMGCMQYLFMVTYWMSSQQQPPLAETVLLKSFLLLPSRSPHCRYNCSPTQPNRCTWRDNDSFQKARQTNIINKRMACWLVSNTIQKAEYITSWRKMTIHNNCINKRRLARKTLTWSWDLDHAHFCCWQCFDLLERYA